MQHEGSRSGPAIRSRRGNPRSTRARAAKDAKRRGCRDNHRSSRSSGGTAPRRSRSPAPIGARTPAWSPGSGRHRCRSPRECEVLQDSLSVGVQRDQEPSGRGLSDYPAGGRGCRCRQDDDRALGSAGGATQTGRDSWWTQGSGRALATAYAGPGTLGARSTRSAHDLGRDQGGARGREVLPRVAMTNRGGPSRLLWRGSWPRRARSRCSSPSSAASSSSARSASSSSR